MTLEEDLNGVTARTADEIATLKEKLDKDVEIAKHYCEIVQESQKVLSDAKSRILKEKISLARQYIEKITEGIPMPEKYDAARVGELRRILSSGAELSVEARCKKLAALRELQAYITKFPVYERVAELVREWTGSDEITISKTDTNHATLRIKGFNVLYVDTNQREIYDNGYRKMSMSNVSVTSPILFLNYDVLAIIVDHWETYCRLTELSPRFILGIDECEKWGENTKPIVDYASNVRKLGRYDGKVDRRSIAIDSKFTDDDLAAAIIINSSYILPIGVCMDSAKNMPAILQDKLSRMIESYFRRIFKRDLENCKGVLKLDLNKREVLWKKDKDEALLFNPDTCEMVHQSLEWTHVDVSNVSLRDLHDYVAKIFTWIEPFKTVVFDVEAKADIVKAVKEHGEKIFRYPLQVGTEIQDVQKVGEDHYQIKVKYTLSEMDVASSCYGEGGKNLNDGIYRLYEHYTSDKELYLSLQEEQPHRYT